jgi:thymidylate synthase
MNNADKQYLELLQDILDNGHIGDDRTGTGTQAVFGRQLRFDMKEGLPAITTKKLHFKAIIHELIWFLGNHVNPESSASSPVYTELGNNNILYLVNNGVNIWVGDCYKRYTTPSLRGMRVYNPEEKFNLTKLEFIDQLKKDQTFSKEWGDIGPGYGQQWRGWKTGKTIALEMVQFTNGHYIQYGEVVIDQISELIEKLKNKPTDRRMMVSAWNVADVPQTLLPPCHYGFTCYTRLLSLEERINLLDKGLKPKYKKSQTEYLEKFTDMWKNFNENFSINEKNSETLHASLDSVEISRRALSLKWNQRSVDTPLGLPFNILSYAILLEMLAKEVNMVTENLIGSLENTHIYLNQMDGVKEQLSREIKHKLPTIWLNPDKSIFTYGYEDVKIIGYESQGKIDFPLSN